jgi:hypothetical protein
MLEVVTVDGGVVEAAYAKTCRKKVFLKYEFDMCKMDYSLSLSLSLSIYIYI